METLLEALIVIAQKMRKAVFTAPSDWPTRMDFELAVSEYIGSSVADQVDLLLRYQQSASVYAASACMDGRGATPEGIVFPW